MASALCANPNDLRITGRVIDRDSGGSIDGAIVEARDANGGFVLATTRSRSDGMYVVPLKEDTAALLIVNLPSGQYAAFHGLVEASRTSQVRIIALSKLSAEESSWLRRVNRDRAQHHVPALAMDEAALLAARAHATDMARYGYLRHIDGRGTQPWQRYLAFFGIGRDYENIAAAQGDSWTDVESAFLAEGRSAHNAIATHYTNLLNPQATWAGLAIAHGTADYFDQELIAFP